MVRWIELDGCAHNERFVANHRSVIRRRNTIHRCMFRVVLHRTHKHNIVHNRVHPQNIRTDPDSEMLTPMMAPPHYWIPPGDLLFVLILMLDL